MGKQVWKPGTMVSPVPPVMVSCGFLEKPNILTIAWTGIVNTIPAMTYISVRPERHSYNIIKEHGEFVINLTTRHLAWAADYCGVKSGANTDKFASCKLTAEPASQVNAPLIKESPVNIECRVKQVIPLGSHDMFLAQIVAVNVDETLVDQNGKLHLDKSGLVAYSHGEYFALGEKLGSFGYSVRKKPKASAHRPSSKKRSHKKKCVVKKQRSPLCFFTLLRFVCDKNVRISIQTGKRAGSGTGVNVIQRFPVQWKRQTIGAAALNIQDNNF